MWIIRRTLNFFSQIVVTEPSYFAWLNSVFAGQISNGTVVANYMIAQLLADEADFINPATAKVASKSNYIYYAMRHGRGIGKYEILTFHLSESGNF